MKILGISGLYHDSAAAIVDEEGIIAAVQEERFTRIKNDNSLPVNAIRYCLKEAGVRAEKLDAVVYYDAPMLTLDRYIRSTLSLGDEASYQIDTRLDDVVRNRLAIDRSLRDVLGVLGREDRLYTVEHHLSHAASAFYPSPFESAATLTIDGVGEWATTTIGVGKGSHLEILEQIDYPHSLGLFYSAFTAFCGFKVNSGEYKFMGLAPYGDPVYADLIKEKLIKIRDDGSFILNLEYFDYYKAHSMINESFEKLFGGPARQPESRITRREMDIAASVQMVTEEIIFLLAKHAKEITGEKNLVMAGGVALNCVANGKLFKEKIFDDIWIQPAAGDAGGALGCALYALYEHFGVERIHACSDSKHEKDTDINSDSQQEKDTDICCESQREKNMFACGDHQQGSYLGPGFDDEFISDFIEKSSAAAVRYDDEDTLCDKVAGYLDDGKVVGWFQGRVEFGPRALGDRSILGDPRREDMQSVMNLRIKYRESFRPFAPIVLKERVSDYFEWDAESPYMLFVAGVNKARRCDFDKKAFLESYDDDMLPIVNAKRSDIPAVTHIDYSARLQTVGADRNPLLHKLMKSFEKRTGCGVLINTSFNVRGEPIVCTPEDAYRCFMKTEMDVLVLGSYILLKDEQTTGINERTEQGQPSEAISKTEKEQAVINENSGSDDVLGHMSGMPDDHLLDDEKKRLKAIAAKRNHDVFRSSVSKSSYIPYDKAKHAGAAISVYESGELRDLKKLLEKLWDGDEDITLKKEVIPIMLAAYYKTKDSEDNYLPEIDMINYMM